MSDSLLISFTFQNIIIIIPDLATSTNMYMRKYMILISMFCRYGPTFDQNTLQNITQAWSQISNLWHSINNVFCVPNFTIYSVGEKKLQETQMGYIPLMDHHQPFLHLFGISFLNFMFPFCAIRDHILCHPTFQHILHYPLYPLSIQVYKGRPFLLVSTTCKL